MNGGHDDYAVEPVPGLPELLPEGEVMLWQGTPGWWYLACDVFHLRAVALYLTALILWRLHLHALHGMAAHDLAWSAAGLVLPALAVIGMLAGLARLVAGSTMYTITSRRIVIRAGVALTMSVNLPFAAIAGASLRLRRDGSGDIALALLPGMRVAYLGLWPHLRLLRLGQPAPMLRGVADAAALAARLGLAMQARLPNASFQPGVIAALAPQLRHPVHDQPLAAAGD